MFFYRISAACRTIRLAVFVKHFIEQFFVRVLICALKEKHIILAGFGVVFGGNYIAFFVSDKVIDEKAVDVSVFKQIIFNFFGFFF